MDHELLALVAGGVDYGDSDRVVHLLTREGRFAAFAHGARKSRKRFAGALEPFTTIRVTLEPRRGKDGMRTLASAVVERARLGLRDDLGKIAVASYVVELAAAVAPEGEDTADLQALAEAALDRLLARPASTALRRAFELHLIDLLGYRPLLDACAHCGLPASPAYLDLAHGGVACAVHRGTAVEVGPKTLTWMGAILDQAALDEDPGLGAEWSERAARKLELPTRAFFTGLLGRPLKSLGLVEDLGL